MHCSGPACNLLHTMHAAACPDLQCDPQSSRMGQQAHLLMVRSRVSMLVREAMEEKGSHIAPCVLARSERPPQLEAALLPR